jgi:hypothetical protein
VAKDLPLAKPGVWGCVQARAQWSTEEDTSDLVITASMSLVTGNGTSCEKQFNLDHHKWEDYRDTHFYNKDSHHGSVAMLKHSSELCAAGF